jgi:hypothetical protein
MRDWTEWDTRASADNVNLLGEDINTIKKNTEALPDASNRSIVGLEVNTKPSTCL